VTKKTSAAGRKLSKLLSELRTKATTKKQRVAIARNAANTRWAKYKAPPKVEPDTDTIT
jgi:hypothetical protein